MVRAVLAQPISDVRNAARNEPAALVRIGHFHITTIPDHSDASLCVTVRWGEDKGSNRYDYLLLAHSGAFRLEAGQDGAFLYRIVRNRDETTHELPIGGRRSTVDGVHTPIAGIPGNSDTISAIRAAIPVLKAAIEQLRRSGLSEDHPIVELGAVLRNDSPL